MQLNETMESKEPDPKKPPHKKVRMTLRFKIGAWFVLFIAIIAGVLWFLETEVLARIYYNSKIKETEQVALMIAEKCQTESVDEFRMTLNQTSYEYQVCISVFDGKERRAWERDILYDNCLLHGYGNHAYRYVTELSSSETGTICLTEYDEKINMDTVVVGAVIGDGDGCVLLNAVLEPVGSTVRFQKRIILIFVVVLLIIGVLIAVILSSHLTVPLVKITDSAKRMAHGDYETKFEGGGCREVDELAEALTYAEQEISKADSMQRDLVANVSHDLRTPLTMLKAYAEMIRDLSGDNPKKRNAHLQVIIDETDRLTALVNDILDLSKLENGSQKLEMKEIDVTIWMTDIIARYKGVSEQMGYHISFTPDEHCQVQCDPAKMERVVCNLINNAINYTGDDKQVFVTQINTENAVRIEVRDTGSGIEKDKIQKIFDKYYRSENHTREVVGTGLGLSIVKAILKLHSFNYGVRSKLGEGSVFWFEIDR